MATLTTPIERVKEILIRCNIEMNVSSCGCCDGAYGTFKYNGEVVLDDDSIEFDNTRKEETL